MINLLRELSNLIDANIADIQEKALREEISLKSCQEKTDKLYAMRDALRKAKVIQHIEYKKTE